MEDISKYNVIIINYGLINKVDVCVKNSTSYSISTYDEHGTCCCFEAFVGIHTVGNTISDLYRDEDLEVKMVSLGKTLLVESIFLGV